MLLANTTSYGEIFFVESINQEVEVDTDLLVNVTTLIECEGVTYPYGGSVYPSPVGDIFVPTAEEEYIQYQKRLAAELTAAKDAEITALNIDKIMEEFKLRDDYKYYPSITPTGESESRFMGYVYSSHTNRWGESVTHSKPEEVYYIYHEYINSESGEIFWLTSSEFKKIIKFDDFAKSWPARQREKIAREVERVERNQLQVKQLAEKQAAESLPKSVWEETCKELGISCVADPVRDVWEKLSVNVYVNPTSSGELTFSAHLTMNGSFKTTVKQPTIETAKQAFKDCLAWLETAKQSHAKKMMLPKEHHDDVSYRAGQKLSWRDGRSATIKSAMKIKGIWKLTLETKGEIWKLEI